MNLDILMEVFNILLSLQCNFNKNICEQVFGLCSEHLYEKWVSSDGNIINFMTRLDVDNKAKLLSWGMTYINQN